MTQPPEENPEPPAEEVDESLAEDPTAEGARREELSETVELVRQYQGGDDEALNQLFARYYDRVLRIVRIRMGRRLRSKMDSMDIVQNTFGAAMASIDDFEMREPGSLIQWLSKIAENQLRGAADYIGAHKRDSRLEIALAGIKSSMRSGEFQYEPEARVISPLEKLSRAELRDILDECVEELPEDYREVILLRNFAGCSWDVITEEMGRVTARATAMLHARARVALLKIARQRIEM